MDANERNRLEAKINETFTRVQALESVLVDHVDQASPKDKEIKDLKFRLEQARKREDELTNELARRTGKLAATQSQLESIQNLRNSEELSKTLDKKERLSLKEENEKLKNELKAANNEISRLMHQRELQQRGRGVGPLNPERINTAPNAERVKELEEIVEQQTKNNAQQNTRIFNMRNELDSARVKKEELDSAIGRITELQVILKSERQRTIAETIRAERAERRINETEEINRNTGAWLEDRNRYVSNLEDQIKNLREQLAASETERSKLNSKIAQAEFFGCSDKDVSPYCSFNRELIDANKNLESTVEALQQKLATVRDTVRQKQHELDDCVGGDLLKSHKIAELELALMEATREIGGQHCQISDLKTELQQKQKQLDESTNWSSIRSQKLVGMELEVNTLELKVDSLRKSNDAYFKENGELKAELKDKCRRYNELVQRVCAEDTPEVGNEDIRGLEQKITNLTLKANSLQNSNEVLNINLNNLQDELGFKHKEIAELEGKLSELGMIVERQKTQMADFREEIARKNKAISELSGMTSRLHEELGKKEALIIKHKGKAKKKK